MTTLNRKLRSIYNSEGRKRTTLNPAEQFKSLTSMKNIEVSCETFTSAVPDCMRPYHNDSTVIEFEYSGASIKHFINEPIQGFTIGQFCGSKYVTQYFLIDINE